MNKKKTLVVNRRYPQASLDVVKKIRTMILKTNPAFKRDIANKLRLSIGTIYNVIKQTIKCRPCECSSAYSSQVWKRTEKVLEIVPDAQRNSKKNEKLYYNWRDNAKSKSKLWKRLVYYIVEAFYRALPPGHYLLW